MLCTAALRLGHPIRFHFASTLRFILRGPSVLSPFLGVFLLPPVPKHVPRICPHAFHMTILSVSHGASPTTTSPKFQSLVTPSPVSFRLPFGPSALNSPMSRVIALLRIRSSVLRGPFARHPTSPRVSHVTPVVWYPKAFDRTLHPLPPLS